MRLSRARLDNTGVLKTDGDDWDDHRRGGERRPIKRRLKDRGLRRRGRYHRSSDNADDSAIESC